MTYADLLPQLRPFKRIVVSGPQRSGTTIAAKIIAFDLNYTFLTEESFNIYDAQKFFRLLNKKNIVIQCPALSHLLAEITDVNTAIVFMWRANRDVRKSENRIGWDFDQQETGKYFRKNSYSVHIKKNIWLEFQKERLGNRAFDLDYSSLCYHSLWVPESLRADFNNRQTEL